MPRYNEVHMQDNPQPGDDPDGKGERVPFPAQTSEDRPRGTTGVEKAHGGGSGGLDAMTATRDGVDDRRRPQSNPNNPDDPDNPASSAYNQPSLGGKSGDVGGHRAEDGRSFTTPTGAAVRRGEESTGVELPTQREEREKMERRAKEKQEKQAAENKAEFDKSREDAQRNRDKMAEDDRAKRAANVEKEREDAAAEQERMRGGNTESKPRF